MSRKTVSRKTVFNPAMSGRDGESGDSAALGNCDHTCTTPV
jgi:hypothetical protein